METINTNQDIQQQPTTPTPEASGEQGGERMFTKDDVNRIVSERLAREREKIAREAEQDTRERELERREQALKAKEDMTVKIAAVKEYYQSKNIIGRALDVAMKGSGAEIETLELDEDGQIKDFTVIDGLIGGVFSGLVSETVTKGVDVAYPPYGYLSPAEDRLADAFKPKI